MPVRPPTDKHRSSHSKVIQTVQSGDKQSQRKENVTKRLKTEKSLINSDYCVVMMAGSCYHIRSSNLTGLKWFLCLLRLTFKQSSFRCTAEIIVWKFQSHLFHEIFFIRHVNSQCMCWWSLSATTNSTFISQSLQTTWESKAQFNWKWTKKRPK